MRSIIKNLRNYLKAFLIFGFFTISYLFSQSIYYPRAKGLGGAYSTIAKGYKCAAYNPAGLAFPGEYRNYYEIGGWSKFATNNFYSLAINGKYGGKDLTANNGELQSEFIDDLPLKGWQINFGQNFPLPLLNFSIGNKAFTTNLLYIGDYYVDRPTLDLVFGNFQKGKKYDINLRLESMMAAEYGFSMGIPYNNLALGFTLKYIQGLGYYGVDPSRSGGYIIADTTNFVLDGSGDLYFRTSNLGRGFSADFGFMTKDVFGTDISIAIKNIGAKIEWNKQNLTPGKMGERALEFMGNQFKTWNTDVQLPMSGEIFKYSFHMDNVNDAEQNGFFQGDSSYKDYFTSSSEIIDSSIAFTTKLPIIIQIGFARNFSDDLLIVMDFTTSFEDKLNYWKGWRSALGAEYSYFPKFPLRMGMAVGGLSDWEIDLGSGFQFGPVQLDWAVGFYDGIWLHTLKGYSFSIGASFSSGKFKNK